MQRLHVRKSSFVLLLEKEEDGGVVAGGGEVAGAGIFPPLTTITASKNMTYRVVRCGVDGILLSFMMVAFMIVINQQYTFWHRHDERSVAYSTTIRADSTRATTKKSTHQWQDLWYLVEDPQEKVVENAVTGLTDVQDQQPLRGLYTMDDDQLWRTSEDDSNDEFDAIASCLMFKDDLRSLREWIPYHYHVANLRYLILRIDPKSRDDPTDLLNKWSDKMQIEIWYNDTFITDKDWDEWRNFTKRLIRDDAQEGTSELVLEQNIFINKCLHRMKERGVGWTMIIDPDEFLRINYRSIASWNENHPTDEPYGFSKPPPMSESGAVMNFLRSEFQRKDQLLGIFDKRCIQMPRSRFGAVESDPDERNRGVPAGLHFATRNKLDALDFDTLRFRYHASPESTVEGNQMAKAMVNLRRLPLATLRRKGNAHSPILGVCPAEKRFTQQANHVLVINHYLGSEEQFLYRSDQRRTSDFFWNLADIRDMNDDAVRPWLDGFVREHGKETSEHLLPFSTA